MDAWTQIPSGPQPAVVIVYSHNYLFADAYISDKLRRLSKALASILSRESLWEISLGGGGKEKRNMKEMTMFAESWAMCVTQQLGTPLCPSEKEQNVQTVFTSESANLSL